MVKLRLRRMGKIDKPFYRIVAVDSRKKRDGKYLENLGYYDPKTEPLTLKVDSERSLYWLGKGAQPSDTVRSLLRKAGVLEKWHKMRFTQTADDKKNVADLPPQLNEIPNEDEKVEEPIEKEKEISTEEGAENERTD